MRERVQEILAAFLFSAAIAGASASTAEAETAVHEIQYGNYRVAHDQLIGIDEFVMDDGERVALISDYESGVVRRLFPSSGSEFVMGPGFNAESPPELVVRFVKDGNGDVTGLSLQDSEGAQRFAQRVPLMREEVSFQGADATLAGTLIRPATKGPHPAIILLHGSGPLTRHSFGPYPHFFTSLGFAVLIYDKRGAGGSTGIPIEAAIGKLKKEPFYPGNLASDALAALRFLQQREDVDQKKIGFWGSSEGGMLATYVAAQSERVAFAINSSGFMEPLWKTMRYQVEANMRARGKGETEIAEALAYTDLWMSVARTGEGWERFQKRQKEVLDSKQPWSFHFGEFTSVEQMRWLWDYLLTFNPLHELEAVTCPVLALFGEMDTSTPSARAAENMERVLTRAGHRDFTIKIFPGAGHSLAEMPSGSRMAKGVFQTLRSWLRAHV